MFNLIIQWPDFAKGKKNLSDIWSDSLEYFVRPKENLSDQKLLNIILKYMCLVRTDKKLNIWLYAIYFTLFKQPFKKNK